MRLYAVDIIVAGATGVLGRHITAALTTAGHRVLGLGRGSANAIRADLLDRDTLLRVASGVRADAVVHAATALQKAPTLHRHMRQTDQLRVKGMANLVEVAGLVGAKRLVSENIVFGYGYRDHGSRLLDEATVFAPTGADAHTQEHLDAMRAKEEMTFSAAGIEGVSLRFGLFYGAGGTETLVRMLRKRQMAAPDDGGRVLAWVDLADAGEAVRLAVERGRPGESYNIVDDTPIGFGEMVRLVAETFRTPKPMPLPRWLLPALPYVKVMCDTSMRVSNRKAREELGWTPAVQSASAGLRSLAAASV